eukprot:3837766-Amphidinium_carterae.1
MLPKGLCRMCSYKRLALLCMSPSLHLIVCGCALHGISNVIKPGTGERLEVLIARARSVNLDMHAHRPGQQQHYFDFLR